MHSREGETPHSNGMYMQGPAASTVRARRFEVNHQKAPAIVARASGELSIVKPAPCMVSVLTVLRPSNLLFPLEALSKQDMGRDFVPTEGVTNG